MQAAEIDDSAVYNIDSQYIVDPTKLLHMPIIKVEHLKSSSGEAIIPLQELIRRNLIKEYQIDGQSLDPRKLEMYLAEDEFIQIFQCTFEEFKQLSLWKQKIMKKRAHLF